MDKVHVFEVAGLGFAPFKFIGLYKIPSPSMAEVNPEAYNNQLREMPPEFGCGTCHFCGTAIMNNFLIISKDGRKHAIGSECILKSGDSGLIDNVKAEKRKAAREKRENAIFERNKKWKAEREAELQKQRDRNPGGLTDYELEKKRLADKEKARREALQPAINKLEPFAIWLERFKNQSGFCLEIAAGFREGKLPFGRGRDIILDVLAKSCGRRNSKAYESEYDRVNEIFYDVEDIINEINFI